jgi:hypothetical protein
MPTYELNKAEAVRHYTVEKDEDFLEKERVGRFSPNSVPYYAMWTHHDLIIIASLLNTITTYLRYCLTVLVIILFLLLWHFAKNGI